MTNEIKEILENIKNKYKDYYVQDIVSGNDLKILLDYITNLQQRIDKAKEYILHEWFKREQIGIAPLQFSYEELQNVLNILRGDE